MKSPLSPLPRRADLTDRECASLIGGLLGSMVQNADIESVRNAVRWWAETDEAWEGLRVMAEAMRNIPAAGQVGTT